MLGTTVGGCDSLFEDPRFTKIVKECADKIRAKGPMAIAVVGGDPEGHCSKVAKPTWDMARLTEAQEKWDKEHPLKLSPEQQKELDEHNRKVKEENERYARESEERRQKIKKACDNGEYELSSWMCAPYLSEEQKSKVQEEKKIEAKKQQDEWDRQTKGREARNRKYCREEWVRYDHTRGMDVSECLKGFGLKPLKDQ
jgi:hypothetical protein